MASPKSSGRMIRKDVSRSHKIASLSERAGFLFFMIIPHLNSYGKMNGSPHFIKGEVVPLIKWATIPVIEKCLREISDKTNLKWFYRDGMWWIHSTNWEEHQEIRKDRVGNDNIPDYSGSTPGVLQDNSGTTPGLVRPEVEVELEVEVEGEGTERSAPATASAGMTDEEYVRYVKDHYNAMIDDPASTQEWRNFYNGAMNIDAQLFAACTWLIENPRRRRSNLKKFYGNWLRKEFQERARKEERSV